jgi:hypothetical protein
VLLSLVAIVILCATARGSGAHLENDALRLELSPSNGAISVTDKRIGFTWRQHVVSGYKVAPETLRVTSDSISYRINGPAETCDVVVGLKPGMTPSFDVTVNLPGKHYTQLPTYPFHFIAPEEKGWYYVQNTSAEGMLMPLDRPNEINKPYGWNGSQPWYGITDLHRGFAVQLDTFRNPDNSSRRTDATVYAVPMRLHFDFLTGGGYVAMAKLYRDSFLATHPELQPLRDRVKARPAVGMLKDGVYVYLWGNDPAEDLRLVTEMKDAGIDRGFAVFYGRHPVDRALFDKIKQLGWVPGLYHMPTGNLFVIGRHGWPNELLTATLSPEQLRGSGNERAWDRICGKYQLSRWPGKAKQLITSYGPQLFYFDTLVVQLAPCLSRGHPSTIEENQQARLQMLQETQKFGMIVGSGEAVSPTWAIPGVDYFEGMMSLRTYADPELKIPRGGYETDLGQSYAADASVLLDEKRRVPLYQLGFHDYVAGTWVWRDTNFQSRPFAWKKDLFNILYGTMQMWHINRALWENHKQEYVASYRAVASVRSRIGFARMTGHGWLTADRTVQYTDWDTGDRVIVNFGAEPYESDTKVTMAPRSFAISVTPRP